MSGSNQFLPFATGGGANTLTPAAYAALTTLLANGFQTGVASSQQLNTVWRQSTFVAAAIAQAIADQTGVAVLDDGVIAHFENQLLVMLQQEPYSICHAGGTSDALTGTFVPAIASQIDGQVFLVRAASSNATTTPTFTPNSGTIAAQTIVKGNGAALAIGDIAGTAHWLALQQDATLGKYVLLNPATGISGASLNGVNLWTKAQRGQVVAMPATTGTVSFDFSASNNFASQVTGACTFGNAFTNAVAGQSGVIQVQQNGSVLYNWSFGTYWKYANGSAAIPSQTQTLGAYDEIVYYVESATQISFAVRSNVS